MSIRPSLTGERGSVPLREAFGGPDERQLVTDPLSRLLNHHKGRTGTGMGRPARTRFGARTMTSGRRI